MYNFKRSDRVSELLRHEISVMVQEIKDHRLGFVTITGVHLSDDLMDARIYYSILGNEEEKKISSEILIKAVPSIRHRLGRRLESLRRVPVLSFVYDDTPMKAQKIDTLFKKLEHERSENPSEEPSPEIDKKPVKIIKNKKK